MIAIDQMGKEVRFNYPPQHIISLVPSQTELLYDLGLDGQVVGITKFCEHPASWRKVKTIVGGTKKLRLDIIESLQPDLIIGNKEENDQASIEALQKMYPVWMSDIVTLEDAMWMIKSIGEITYRMDQGEAIVSKIVSGFAQIKKRKAKVLYLIWRRPWMGAGSGTFIHSMLQEIGFTNVLADQSRYPEITPQQIRALQPDHILLSSEPYPFSEKHIDELKEICPAARLALVDGQFFSWYGSRLIGAPDYFNSLVG